MSTQLIVAPNAIPALAVPNDLLTKVQAQLAQVVANQVSAMPRLSFGGKQFNITINGTEVPLDDRVLDVHILAIDPNFHYVFNQYKYDDVKDSADKGNMWVRYPLPTDEVIFTPTAEWATRQYKQRAVVMLANDPEHRLFVVDFGYNSIKKVGNPSLGLLNLSQLMTQFQAMVSQNPQVAPFMFTVQMSFTREVQPEIQFSLIDQRNPGNYEARFANAGAFNAMLEALSNGEADKMIKVDEYRSGNHEQATAPVQAQAPVAPVQAPVASVQAPTLATL